MWYKQGEVGDTANVKKGALEHQQLFELQNGLAPDTAHHSEHTIAMIKHGDGGIMLIFSSKNRITAHG